MGKTKYPTVGMPDLMGNRGHPAEFNGQKGIFGVWMSTATAYFLPEEGDDHVILHPGDVIGVSTRDSADGQLDYKTFQPRDGYDPSLPADAKKHLASMRANRAIA